MNNIVSITVYVYKMFFHEPLLSLIMSIIGISSLFIYGVWNNKIYYSINLRGYHAWVALIPLFLWLCLENSIWHSFSDINMKEMSSLWIIISFCVTAISIIVMIVLAFRDLKKGIILILANIIGNIYAVYILAALISHLIVNYGTIWIMLIISDFVFLFILFMIDYDERKSITVNVYVKGEGYRDLKFRKNDIRDDKGEKYIRDYDGSYKRVE